MKTYRCTHRIHFPSQDVDRAAICCTSISVNRFLYFRDSRSKHPYLYLTGLIPFLPRGMLFTGMHKSLSTESKPLGLVSTYYPYLTWGGGGRIPCPLMFFFHHPETLQAMKLKLSDFKDTSLRHNLQVFQVCYILRCYHETKLQRYLAKFDSIKR